MPFYSNRENSLAPLLYRIFRYPPRIHIKVTTLHDLHWRRVRSVSLKPMVLDFA